MSHFVATPDQLMPKMEPRQKIVLLARTLWREGYNDHLAGHITYNLGDGTLLCNPWFLLWNEFRADDVIRIDLDGNVVEGAWPVPPGIPLHLELHRARHDVQVALHNHSQWGTVWADMGKVPPCHDQSSALGGGTLVLVDEYDGPVNDPDLARRAVEKMDGADMALLAGHGVFITGRSIRAVHQRAVALEWRCRMAHAVMAAGVSGGELPAEIRDRFGGNDGAGFIGFWEAMVRQELRQDPSLLD
ncbi:MAG TPA: class II aldolase/adducin family protein [Acidimicrobiales bacterium]|nr:class II aldolase/adducin family protein [Acidimicrobiales bacterium]